MKRTLWPDWPADEIAGDEQLAEKWMTLVSGSGDETGGTPFGAGQTSAAAVLAKHQAKLMAYPNVVAVSDGVCASGDAAGQACINVYVSEKVEAGQLDAAQRLPDQVEGVRIEVIEAGEIGTLPKK